MIHVNFDAKVAQVPELKGEGEKQYTRLSLVTDKFVSEGKGDERDGKPTSYKATWLNATAFGRQAQYLVNRFSKGDTIVVNDAELDVQTYAKKDPEKGTVVDPKALSINVILRDFSGPYRSAPKVEGDSAVSTATTTSKKKAISADDIPF